MKFQVGGISVILKGDPNLSTSLVSLKTLWKAIRRQGEGVLVELGCIGVMEFETEIEIPSPIQAMLAQFHKVFNVQVGLPPRRSLIMPLHYTREHPLLMSGLIVTLKFKRGKLNVWSKRCWLHVSFNRALALFPARCY